MASEIEICPLRGLNDFLLESARFQVPNFKDLDKWENRIINNLLYYQTNYMVSAIIIFLFVGIMSPGKMLCGMLAICVAFSIFYYITNSKAAATRFKKNHPLISLRNNFCRYTITCGYFIVYVLGSVFVFLFGIVLPIIVVLIHASLRLRNMKNKLANKMESVGLRKTPMSIFLETIGKESGSGL
ncbi:PRA1 family protein 3 [Nymphon striatum]|nr:PRA1 family protein 3 [Nymphon striatum]